MCSLRYTDASRERRARLRSGYFTCTALDWAGWRCLCAPERCGGEPPSYGVRSKVSRSANSAARLTRGPEASGANLASAAPSVLPADRPVARSGRESDANLESGIRFVGTNGIAAAALLPRTAASVPFYPPIIISLKIRPRLCIDASRRASGHAQAVRVEPGENGFAGGAGGEPVWVELHSGAQAEPGGPVLRDRFASWQEGVQFLRRVRRPRGGPGRDVRDGVHA